MTQKIEIDDAIILLMGTTVPGVREGEIQGITRLEKLVFLLEKETESSKWLDQSAEFKPYNFGPFSEKVYQAVDMLAAAELIEDSYSPASDDTDTWEQRECIGRDNRFGNTDPFTTRNFRLTERGKRYFEALSKELPQDSLDEIGSFKKRFAFLPLRQLIRYVYLRYENFTTESLIRDQVLGG
ncbi:hypothetical protein GALL_361760 [mine drainage metagenome]|uniref:Antitoxin SocA-like Panacea domain-containing protein n=1 Tax=mine drainage metagenome TaxID=410659 RepID=A0A1J5QX48_9ZZZZ